MCLRWRFPWKSAAFFLINFRSRPTVLAMSIALGILRLLTKLSGTTSASGIGAGAVAETPREKLREAPLDIGLALAVESRGAPRAATEPKAPTTAADARAADRPRGLEGGEPTSAVCPRARDWRGAPEIVERICCATPAFGLVSASAVVRLCNLHMSSSSTPTIACRVFRAAATAFMFSGYPTCTAAEELLTLPSAQACM
mmetsp:Transcript_24650/g.71272  ORF Transcript_24650/g.71272 Transcript_24650/m.71272 type:complete len:200 (-) Transcript_24650:39-638(-)